MFYKGNIVRCFGNAGYIAEDKVSAAIKFASELEELLFLIPGNPFKYKQSVYFDNQNIRDMTYKGYTINYRVDFEKDAIEVLRIFNRNKPPLNK